MIMIQYRQENGTLGEFDPEKLDRITVENGRFTARLIHYGWDEYDYEFEEISNIIELRI